MPAKTEVDPIRLESSRTCPSPSAPRLGSVSKRSVTLRTNDAFSGRMLGVFCKGQQDDLTPRQCKLLSNLVKEYLA